MSHNGTMTDLERILKLWRELESAAADYVLATVFAVQGPSYRKPGALMLLSPDGRRAGTVSGGCLEAQIASRAWWLTANGPTVQRYSTAEDDGDRPFGSGCGGVVFLLLERRKTAAPLLAAVERSFNLRVPLAVATVLEGRDIGHRVFAGLEGESPTGLNPEVGRSEGREESLRDLAERALSNRKSIESAIAAGEISGKAWADYRPARHGLWVFGAGDDAQPLLCMAKELGWFVSVSDGRGHLATRERFPLADELHILPIEDLPGCVPGQSPHVLGGLGPDDTAVIMTHSFEQDTKILAYLLMLDTPPAYTGVLGPQRRTRELLSGAAHLLNIPPSETNAKVERWLTQLHAPTGLDLGAESPETISLSIIAEIQKFHTAATALPLRTLRKQPPVDSDD